MTNRIRMTIKRRAWTVTVILIVACFGLAVIGLVKVQLIQGKHYKQLAEENQLRDTEIAAQRGIIYDSNMKPLAESASVWKVYIHPNKIGNDTALRETIAKKLSEILKVDYNTIIKKASTTDYNYYEIKSRVEKAEKDKVAEFCDTYRENADGTRTYYEEFIGIDPDVKRYYPYGNLASTLIGFTGTGDIGRYGLELEYDSVLTGIPGRELTAYDGSSSGNGPGLNYETVYEAKQGTSVVLTIDSTIQRYLETALENAEKNTKARKAYAIVMDTKTGAILAMANKPDYDLNDPEKVISDIVNKKINAITDKKKKAQALSDAIQNQWSNSTVTSTYEPGSVFKVITAAASIEEGVADENTHFTCTGNIRIEDTVYNCHNTAGHGTQTLAEGLMNSCNPFFITIGQKLGIKKFYEYFEAFGFMEKTGIDLPGEVQPVEGSTYHREEDRGPVQLASTSFGQSIEVSQIQMITAINAVANGGKLMKPYIVSRLIDENGNTVSTVEPKVKRQVISEATANKVAKMMEKVVAEGTGKNAYVPGYKVAGKTGTSDKLNKVGYVVASFAGFAPANDPKITVIVTIDEPSDGSGGGAVAAPVVGEVIEKTLKYMNVEPQYTKEEAKSLDTKAPNLVGKKIDDAVSVLEKNQFNVKILGNGNKVISQTPAYNKPLPQGGTVVLYTQTNVKNNTTSVPDFTGMAGYSAIYAAAEAGINIKFSGNAGINSDALAYMQGVEPGATIRYGETVTVYFKSNSGITDD